MARQHSLGSWLFNWFTRRTKPIVKSPPQTGNKLRLETLEERLPPGDLFHVSSFLPNKPAVTSTAKRSTARSNNTTATTEQSSPAKTTTTTQTKATQSAKRATPPPVFQTTTSNTSSGFEPSGSQNNGAANRSGGAMFGTNSGGEGGSLAGILNTAGSITRGGPGGDTPDKTGDGGDGGTTNPPPDGGAQNSPVHVTSLRNAANKVNITNKVSRETKPIVVGTARRMEKIRVWIDGKAVGTATANHKGNWTFATPRALAHGVHYFAASPLNARQAPNAEALLSVDLKGPQIHLAAPEFVRKNDVAWVQLSVTDPDNNGHRDDYRVDVDLNRDGKFTGNELNFGRSTTEYQELTPLPEGKYRVRARAVDNIGNWGASNIVTMQFDPNAGVLGSQILQDLAGTGATIGTPPNYSKLIRMQDNKVLIDVRATLPKYMNDLLLGLQSLGFESILTTASSNMYTGWLPINQIASLPGISSFSGATPVFLPVMKVGAVTAEGDAIMKGPAFRSKNNVNGSGIKVGVISDSVNNIAGGLAAGIASGDLPQNGVQILQDLANGGTDEGRAMLEIVFDTAPGSSLAFATGAMGPTGFAQAIRNLAAAGSKVITDDLGYPNSPMFNAGRMGVAIDDVVSKNNVVYLTAGGNDGDYAWRGTWTPISTTVGGTQGTYMSFNGSPFQPFTLPANQDLTLSFGWDATFLEGGGIDVPNNVDVFIVRRDTNAVVASFTTDNRNTDEAFELLTFTNNLSGVTDFAFAYQLVAGPAPQKLSWMNFGSRTGVDINALGQGASTMLGQVLAARAITLGAVDHTTPTVPEPFTSLGGKLEIFADDQGNRLSSPTTRLKPDITAPDGVHTTFFGQDDGNGGFLFFGTSAAAPAAAGAVALLLDQQPIATPFDISLQLQLTAQDIAATGFDFLTGIGLLQLENLNLGIGSFEVNETSERAVDFGRIGKTAVTPRGLSIGSQGPGRPDYDWFTFTANVNGKLNVQMLNPNLELNLYVRNGSLLKRVANGTQVQQGAQVYVEVKGRQLDQNTFGTGLYLLSMALA